MVRLIDADALIGPLKLQMESYDRIGAHERAIAYSDCIREIGEAPTVDDRELLPCPFCGGKALGPTDAWPHTITCEQCGAAVKGLGYGEEGMREAVKKWNRRVKDEAN